MTIRTPPPKYPTNNHQLLYIWGLGIESNIKKSLAKCQFLTPYSRFCSLATYLLGGAWQEFCKPKLLEK